MGLDTTASNVAMGQLSALPFENIIGGPLNAAIKAQAQAALTTVDFIQAVGMQDNGSGQLEAINIEFNYQDGNGGFRKLSVPLLTVIPIPFIVIDAVDIAFKARIAASASQSSSTSSETNFGLGVKAEGHFGGKSWGGSVEINASYSSKKDSKASQDSTYSVEYTMDVHVHASQSGLPQGMAQILNILQDGISNAPQENRIALFGMAPLVKSSQFDEFIILVLDSGDNPLSGWTLSVISSNTDVIANPAPVSGSSSTYKAIAGTVTDPTDVQITITAISDADPTKQVSTVRTIRVVP